MNMQKSHKIASLKGKGAGKIEESLPRTTKRGQPENRIIIMEFQEKQSKTPTFSG